jgi:hypothetical protein
MTPIATVRDYNELHAALHARADALSVSRGATDDVSGLPPGYSGKLLGPKSPKLFGVKSRGAILTVLGLKMVLVMTKNHRENTPRVCQKDTMLPCACFGPEGLSNGPRSVLSGQGE